MSDVCGNRGGKRAGAGRKPSRDRRLRLQAYVLPETVSALNTLAFAQCRPLGHVVDDMVSRHSKTVKPISPD